MKKLLLLYIFIITAQDVNSSMVDDDPNDPEYNFLSEAEAEDDIEDKFDEFRDDRAVKIPS